MAHTPLPPTLTMDTLPSPFLATLQVTICYCYVTCPVYNCPNTHVRAFCHRGKLQGRA